jgi:hypothetical protein
MPPNNALLTDTVTSPLRARCGKTRTLDGNDGYRARAKGTWSAFCADLVLMDVRRMVLSRLGHPQGPIFSTVLPGNPCPAEWWRCWSRWPPRACLSYFRGSRPIRVGEWGCIPNREYWAVRVRGFIAVAWGMGNCRLTTRSTSRRPQAGACSRG